MVSDTCFLDDDWGYPSKQPEHGLIGWLAVSARYLGIPLSIRGFSDSSRHIGFGVLAFTSTDTVSIDS